MIYPNNFESRIGFDTLRAEVNKYCDSEISKWHCTQMHFSNDVEQVKVWLSQTAEFLDILNSKFDFPLGTVFDLRAPLKAILMSGTYLSTENLDKLRKSLVNITGILKFFKSEKKQLFPHLAQVVQDIDDFPELLEHINLILDKFGNVKDTASPLLQSLRSQLASTTASLNGIMRHVITAGKQAGYLDADVQPSMRDGRLVIPVSPMNKRKIKGIMHDASASGKTFFIEPEEIVEANNRIREIEGDIAYEIVRILTEITDIIRPYVNELLHLHNRLGLLEFIKAKALFARDVDGQMPNIEHDCQIEWYHAMHPALLLALRPQNKQVVPLDIEMNEKQRIILISGPNAGGKSVCLKTVGVVQYMMQCGLLPTLYYNSHMGFFDDIFIDIGDQQSIEDDLSTYSSHLQNMKVFLSKGNMQSLVLIDEFGSGTEPQIGGAIAQAILQQLNLKKIFAVITTHYQNLKHFAEQTEGVANGAMLYDRSKMKPLFQLSVGYPGSSFAVEIARNIGLPKIVIDNASEIVGSDYINMDKYLLDILRDRKYWEKKRHEVRLKEKKLEALTDEYERKLKELTGEKRLIIKNAREEAKTILDQSNAEIERTIKEIKEVQAEKDKTREVRQRLDEFKQRLMQNDSKDGNESLQSRSEKQSRGQQKPKKKLRQTDVVNEPIKQGDNVILKGASTVGKVISIDEKYALVAFGNLKTRVETSRLERTLRQADKAQSAPSISNATTQHIRERQLQFKPEIDVRGMRGDEAIQAVTYFIDDAIQFASARVRILHGTGNGILRQLIREYLNSVPEVKSYRDEHVQLGGAGITIVDLK